MGIWPGFSRNSAMTTFGHTHKAQATPGCGNAIDEVALAEVLCTRRLGGVEPDVFREEPLPPDFPLRTAPNCFGYPHASAFAPEYLDLYFKELAAEMGGRVSVRQIVGCGAV